MHIRQSAIYFANIAATIFFICCSGCVSANYSAKDNNTSWLDYVAIQDSCASNQFITVDGRPYTASQITADIHNIRKIIADMDDLIDDLSILTSSISTADIKYFTENDNNQAEDILFQFTKQRARLAQILRFYHHAQYPDDETRTKGAALLMYAGINKNYYESRLVTLSINNKKIIKLLNASHSKYNIPKNSYNKIFLDITDLATINMVDTAWKLFEKELYNRASRLAQLSETDSEFDFVSRLKKKYIDSYVQTRYILYASGKVFANVENRLRHTKARELGDIAKEIAGSGLYEIQGIVYKNVARIKNPQIHTIEFSDKQTKKIKKMLKPGDIILTYTAGYMSNIFLPGKFKHGITYIGTVQQRMEAGMTVAEIKNMVSPPEKFQQITNNLQVAEQPAGYEANVIEAVAEGVIINSLDYLLKTHINRMVVLRPNISESERTQMLVDLFLDIGTPYDFHFDFSDDSYQCCTELIYRVLNNKGGIDMQFSRLKGKWILSADNIVEYCLNTNPEAFEVILLAENSNINNRAKIITGPESRRRLRQIMLPANKPTKEETVL